MDLAFIEEQEARRARRETRADPPPGKHEMEAESSADGAKRAKIEIQAGLGQGRGAEVDVSSLPAGTVIELVMAGLGGVSFEHLRWAFDVSRVGSARAHDRMPDGRFWKTRRMLYLCLPFLLV